MEVRLLALGIFEYYKENIETNYIQSRLYSFLRNKVFCFDFNLTEDTQVHYPKYGFFYPMKVETTLCDNFKDTLNDFIILKRQPKFYCFVIPYPTLIRTAIQSGYKTYSNATNMKNFYETYNSIKDERFRRNDIQSDLLSRIEIYNSFTEVKPINNFFENNCHTLIIESQEELCILISDFIHFMKSVLDITITLDSLSKIIIPFFELSEDEKMEVFQIDDLPF